MRTWLLVILLTTLACGGGEEGNADPAVAEGEETSVLVGDEVLPEELAEPEVGDAKCEGDEIFILGNGGAWVYVETCSNGLSCVAESGTCECVPACDGKTCGEDGCGGTCGDCSTDMLCHINGVCSEECLPLGDGTYEGTHIRNMDWQAAGAGAFSLHEFCNEKEVIILVEVAGW